jgi:DnaJ family protein C protein 28
MDILQQIAESKIQQAMQAGQFDNLPGKGKPLHLEENPFEDPAWRTAHAMLKSLDLTLPWIEVRRDLLNDLEVARHELDEAAQRHAAGGSPVAWQAAQQTYCARLADLNRRILSYNIQAPLSCQLSVVSCQ